VVVRLACQEKIGWIT